MIIDSCNALAGGIGWGVWGSLKGGSGIIWAPFEVGELWWGWGDMGGIGAGLDEKWFGKQVVRVWGCS